MKAPRSQEQPGSHLGPFLLMTSFYRVCYWGIKVTSVFISVLLTVLLSINVLKVVLKESKEFL